jgi:uncharacterized PurR-regulated membrane protein YhhQ (DUF165 family)
MSGFLAGAMLAMVLVVAASNVLVMLPINAWMTWGSLSYPFTYLVTDLTNRRHGAKGAQQVVYVGFAVGAPLSIWLASPRLAVASLSAFVVSQLLDVWLFSRLRCRLRRWWQPPLASPLLACIPDTVLFFAIAFAGSRQPWLQWAMGDYAVKALMGVVLLGPFRVLAGTAAWPGHLTACDGTRGEV